MKNELQYVFNYETFKTFYLIGLAICTLFNFNSKLLKAFTIHKSFLMHRSSINNHTRT